MPGRAVAATALLVALAPAADARARPSADTAALQVALRAVGTYGATVDGVRGPATVAAVRAFQRRRGLAADGVAGPRTRRALGRRGRPAYGSRLIGPDARGWDVAALQFALAVHGFPSGGFDGGFGARTEAALLRFQRFAGVPATGRAGPLTRRALRAPPPTCPVALARPVAASIGDAYGPRGAGMHAGIDMLAGAGTPVTAARAGRVVTAGYVDGWGLLVVVDHGGGVQTAYAHLSRILVRVGTPVVTGALLGRVGATGHATGPHLHFEVRVRGAYVDPAPALRLTRT